MNDEKIVYDLDIVTTSADVAIEQLAASGRLVGDTLRKAGKEVGDSTKTTFALVRAELKKLASDLKEARKGVAEIATAEGISSVSKEAKEATARVNELVGKVQTLQKNLASIATPTTNMSSKDSSMLRNMTGAGRAPGWTRGWTTFAGEQKTVQQSSQLVSLSKEIEAKGKEQLLAFDRRIAAEDKVSSIERDLARDMAKIEAETKESVNAQRAYNAALDRETKELNRSRAVSGKADTRSVGHQLEAMKNSIVAGTLKAPGASTVRSPELDDFQKRLTAQMGRSSGAMSGSGFHGFNKIDSFFAKSSMYIYAAERIAGGIETIASSIWELGERGAKLKDMEASFEKMNSIYGNADLEGMSKALGGTVSEAEMMKMANLSRMMGVSGENTVKFAAIAKAAARSLGESTSELYDDIMKGAARMSRMRLDNLGINIERLPVLYAKTAKELKKSMSELTIEEKNAAVQKEILRVSGNILASSTSSETDAYEQQAAALQNLKDKLAMTADTMLKESGLMGVAGGAIGGLESIFESEDAQRVMKTLSDTVVELGGTFASIAEKQLPPLMMQIEGLMKVLGSLGPVMEYVGASAAFMYYPMGILAEALGLVVDKGMEWLEVFSNSFFEGIGGGFQSLGEYMGLVEMSAVSLQTHIDDLADSLKNTGDILSKWKNMTAPGGEKAVFEPTKYMFDVNSITQNVVNSLERERWKLEQMRAGRAGADRSETQMKKDLEDLAAQEKVVFDLEKRIEENRSKAAASSDKIGKMARATREGLEENPLNTQWDFEKDTGAIEWTKEQWIYVYGSKKKAYDEIKKLSEDLKIIEFEGNGNGGMSESDRALEQAQKNAALLEKALYVPEKGGGGKKNKLDLSDFVKSVEELNSAVAEGRGVISGYGDELAAMLDPVDDKFSGLVNNIESAEKAVVLAADAIEMITGSVDILPVFSTSMKIFDTFPGTLKNVKDQLVEIGEMEHERVFNEFIEGLGGLSPLVDSVYSEWYDKDKEFTDRFERLASVRVEARTKEEIEKLAATEDGLRKRYELEKKAHFAIYLQNEAMDYGKIAGPTEDPFRYAAALNFQKSVTRGRKNWGIGTENAPIIWQGKDAHEKEGNQFGEWTGEQGKEEWKNNQWGDYLEKLGSQGGEAMYLGIAGGLSDIRAELEMTMTDVTNGFATMVGGIVSDYGSALQTTIGEAVGGIGGGVLGSLTGGIFGALGTFITKLLWRDEKKDKKTDENIKRISEKKRDIQVSMTIVNQGLSVTDSVATQVHSAMKRALEMGAEQIGG